MALFTREQACRQVGIGEDEADDRVFLLLDDYTAAITASIELYKHETIDPVEVVEKLHVRPGDSIRLAKVPVVDLVSVVSRDGLVTWDVANLDVSAGGLITHEAGPWLYGRIVVTYNAGYATPPPNYVQGALVIFQHVWETQRGVGELEGGVIGPEEMHQRIATASPFPRKALEWLGAPRPVVF